MRLPIVLPLIAVLVLGACHKASGPADSAASDPAANAKAAETLADMHFQPGLYQAKVEIKQFDMPGMPKGLVEAMKSRMLEKPLTYCLTAEDAAKGAQSMKERMGKGQCHFDRFDASGGTVDSDMTCQSSSGKGTLHAVAHGTYTETSSVMSSKVDMAVGGAGQMHMEQVTTTTRVGDCTK
jgi:hypothetical protein